MANESRPTITFTYDERGNTFTNLIRWKGELIQVISDPANAPTREFQRADEIVRALIKAYHG